MSFQFSVNSQPSEGISSNTLKNRPCRLLWWSMLQTANILFYILFSSVRLGWCQPNQDKVSSQIQELSQFAHLQLDNSCRKWSADQRAVYADAVRIGLLKKLKRPLSEEKMEQFKESFRRIAESYANYVPGSGDAFADAELSFEALRVDMVDRCAKFGARESDKKAEEEMKKALRQVPELVKVVSKEFQQYFPGLKPVQIHQIVSEYSKLWERWVNDVLTPGLKRPLTDEEINALRKRIPEMCTRAKQMVARVLRYNPEWIKENNREVRTIQMASARITSFLLSTTDDTGPSEEYIKVMKQISEQHRTRGEEWMKEQRKKFVNDFVISVVKPAIESDEQTLFLIEQIFLFRNLATASGTGFYY